MGRLGGLRVSWRRLDPLPLLWLVATVVVWGARGFGSGLYRDAAFYLYAGQVVADGNAPYVEVMTRTGPYASLIPGLGVELGRLFGSTDALGARILCFALVVTTPAMAYLTARDGYGSRLAGCAAAAALLGFHTSARLATSGPESKLLMMAGLSVTLMLLVRRRWLLAGISTGFATLTWQPVLLALAPAAAVLLLLDVGRAHEKVTAGLRYAVGGLLALAVTVGGFAAAGATQAFVEGFWMANAEHTSQTGIVDRPTLVWSNLSSALGWGLWVLVGGTVAALLLGLSAPWLRRTAPRQAAARAMIGVSVLGGVLWSGYAFNRAPDTLLLLPGAALGVGGAVGVLAHLVRRSRSPHPRRALVAITAAWVAISVALTLAFTVSTRSDTLADQQASTDAVFDNLPADATVFTVEAPQPLALGGRRSVSRFMLFGHGMLGYVAAQTPGGLPGYMTGIIEEEPDVVFLPAAGRDPLVARLMVNYRHVGDGPDWRVYVRESLDPETFDRIAEALVEA